MSAQPDPDLVTRVAIRSAIDRLSILLRDPPDGPVRVESRDGRLRIEIVVSPDVPDGAASLPSWDGRSLRWRGVPVHMFRQPAERQTTLLDAFQESGWPARIADPFRDPKTLSDTMAALNKSLPPGTVRFHGDGNGDACWCPS